MPADHKVPSQGSAIGTHLDLGCGKQPRNPYGRERCVGVDMHDGVGMHDDSHYVRANLATEPIPFPDDSFESVSAFDFIEHVPRQSIANGTVVMPFITLMNEIARVLKPGGLFYAMTPAFPSPAAFQDPTHVNIITIKTHTYFCGDDAYARIYGFTGEFKTRRMQWVVEKNAYTAENTLRKTLRAWHRRITCRQPTHLLWELEVVK